MKNSNKQSIFSKQARHQLSLNSSVLFNTLLNLLQKEVNWEMTIFSVDKKFFQCNWVKNSTTW